MGFVLRQNFLKSLLLAVKFLLLFSPRVVRVI
jgi:hypothetical protein